MTMFKVRWKKNYVAVGLSTSSSSTLVVVVVVVLVVAVVGSIRVSHPYLCKIFVSTK